MKYYGGFLVSGLLSLKGSLLAIKIFTIILCKLLYVFVCQINVLKLKLKKLTCFPVGLIWGMNPYVKPLVILKLTSGSVHIGIMGIQS